MTSRIEEYEKKLSAIRRGVDRSSKLEARLQSNRTAGAAQKEREEALSENCDAGTDASYAQLATDHETAVVRATGILGPGAVEDKRSSIRPAIAFSTCIPSLDRALGGGVPSGIVEIYGPESVGKTTLLMEMMRGAQDQGLSVALLPTELFDWNRATRVGINLNTLLLLRGKDERVLSAAADYLGGERRALFIDSATGIRPEEGSWWQAMLSWFEGVAGTLGPTSSIIMTNQVRVKRSVDPRKFFVGVADSTARRLASYFDVRMELSRENVSEHQYDMVINLVVNLYSAPHKVVFLPVVKARGIDVWKDVVRVAGELGVLEARGAHFYYEGVHLGHGEEETARSLEYDVLDESGTPREIGNQVFQRLMQIMSR